MFPPQSTAHSLAVRYLRRNSFVTLALTLLVLTSLLVTPALRAAGGKLGVNLDQLQNGNPAGTNAQWANGSINGSNSVYHEGESIPFRFFVTGLKAGATQHTFTIQWEYKKGGLPAYDYLTSFNRAPNGGYINGIGGPCSNTATAVPKDCATPTDVAAFPDPVGGYGLPFTPNVPLSERQLKAYNVASVTFGAYFVTGTTNDAEINLPVTFTTANLAAGASAGFYWGGHLSRGVQADWGAGNGASSISGAPFHMRTQNLDNGGASNQDRSVQPGAVLPELTCGISPTGNVCGGATTHYTSSIVGDSYIWSIQGNADFIVGGNPTTANQTTAAVDVRAHASGSYTLTLTVIKAGFSDGVCTLSVNINPVPAASISADGSTCGVPQLTAHVAGGDVTGDMYTWSGPGVPAGQEHNQSIFPTAPGTYSVTVTRSGCTSDPATGVLCFTFTPQ